MCILHHALKYKYFEAIYVKQGTSAALVKIKVKLVHTSFHNKNRIVYVQHVAWALNWFLRQLEVYNNIIMYVFIYLFIIFFIDVIFQHIIQEISLDFQNIVDTVETEREREMVWLCCKPKNWDTSFIQFPSISLTRNLRPNSDYFAKNRENISFLLI